MKKKNFCSSIFYPWLLQEVTKSWKPSPLSMKWYYHICCRWQNCNLLPWSKHLAQKSVNELDSTQSTVKFLLFVPWWRVLLSRVSAKSGLKFISLIPNANKNMDWEYGHLLSLRAQLISTRREVEMFFPKNKPSHKMGEAELKNYYHHSLDNAYWRNQLNLRLL